jgi:NDP-sugar pyrophosphorylase family protein
MKAMIFAAGLGTRLKPFTNYHPKALAEVNGITLLELAIRKLSSAGISDIIINVHHFSEQILDFLQQKNKFGINIEISDESDKLLDTGGGLKKASWFFNDNKSFLVYNVDVISDIDLDVLFHTHLQSGSIATLAVKHRSTARYFLFNDGNQLCGWQNVKTGEKKIARESIENLTPLAFSGIQLIHPSIFPLITEEGKFSMTDIYIRLATYHNITGYKHNEDIWMDLGKPENIEEASTYLRINPELYD